MSESKKFRSLSNGQVEEIVNFLKGQVLTAVESLGLGDKREKAFKDIIHGYFGNCVNKAWRHAIGESVFPPSEEDIEEDLYVKHLKEK